MRLGIFSRLIIGYQVTFILFMGVSVYAIFELDRFNSVTRNILNIDNRIIDYEKKLTDSLLSQMRYERKYIIIKDEVLYDQFLLVRDEFSRNLDEVMSVVESSQDRDLLLRVKDYYQRYQSLIEEEVGFIRADQPYPQDFYKQEKERVADGIMEELKRLKVFYENATYDRIKKLDKTGDSARKVAIVLAVMALLWGITISLLITRSITKPLSVMIDKTKEIATGIFKGDLNLSSPSEMGRLAKAFNTMCDRLNMVDKMKSDFFATMSHELRTPLTSIKEGVSLLLEGIGGEVTERQKRLLTIIAEESHRLIGLVNSHLDLSKMEAGMMTFNFVQADITPLIDKAVKEVEPLAISKGITLKKETLQDLPAIRMDRERILQVLRNLIGNAVKFTPDGGQVKVSARLVDGNLEVSVADTGTGIPRENLTTIFEKFHQVPLTGSYQITGTGLGLAIVKYIVTTHGGEVWAESKAGQGSSFIFLLPVSSYSP